MKIRADVLLTQRGLTPSRERAQALIMAGKVYSGERKIQKSSEPLAEDAPLSVRDDDSYASRGGYKLEKALKTFDVNPSGLTVMDIGAASGGFTDVLLRNGAGRVYAVDVGYGQLDWRLRNDPRVIVMERTNARYLTADDLLYRPQLAVMDVSFISIQLIIPALTAIMGEQGRIVSLIKPQFEAGKDFVGKNGVVREKSTHVRVLRDVAEFVAKMGWHINGFTWSPIKGPAGNIEFLTDIVKAGDETITEEMINRIVTEAHLALD